MNSMGKISSCGHDDDDMDAQDPPSLILSFTVFVVLRLNYKNSRTQTFFFQELEVKFFFPLTNFGQRKNIQVCGSGKAVLKNNLFAVTRLIF